MAASTTQKKKVGDELSLTRTSNMLKMTSTKPLLLQASFVKAVQPSIFSKVSDCHFNNKKMVKLHIKRGDESVLLYETTVQVPIQDLINQLVKLHNGILKVQRLCQGIIYIANYLRRPQ